MTQLPATPDAHLRWREYALIIMVAVAFYGPAIFGGRPLSVHEARLPQLAHEMVADAGNWLLPTSGGRPWLERPPLPHWVTATSLAIFGGDKSIWAARLPASLAGCAIGCMSAWMTARWLGRSAGLLAGVVTISSYEIYQYATLAEDDIYLGVIAVAAMAVFIREQWSGRSPDLRTDIPRGGFVRDFVGGRSWSMILFFVLVGLTNWVKGPLVGAVPIIATVGIYLLWNRDIRSLRKYAWLWGWLIFIALTLAWPLWAMKHYPDVIDNWRFDYFGEITSTTAATADANKWDQPWFYYLWALPLSLSPWSWATVLGMVVSARRARTAPSSPQRMIWCWAVVSLIVLSLPTRKHHQYLVPIIVPWAIFSTLGLLRIGRWLAAWQPRRPILQYAVTAIIIISVTAGGWVQLRSAARSANTLAEVSMMDSIQSHVPAGEPVLINADIDSLGFFRLQYYLQHTQRLIQNLSYLRDVTLDDRPVYVLTRGRDESYLRQLGAVKRLLEEDANARDLATGHNFVLFQLTRAADLREFQLPQHVSVMQAMGRQRGPWLGDGVVPPPD